MKKYILAFSCILLSHFAFTQAEYTLLNALLDSIHQLNDRRSALGNDTAEIKKFFRENYKPLKLFDNPGYITWEYIHFDVDMTNYTTVHQCMVDRANKNGWHIEWDKPDETGFRKLTIYDTKKKKNKIFFYRNFQSSIAHRETKKDKFSLGISLNW